MDDYTIITPTGDRPETFKLCYRYVLRQSVQPSNWIVIDDGETPTPMPDISFLTYVRRTKKPTDPQHTLPCQVLEALNYVKTNNVLIFEDDDWYNSDYAETYLNWFNRPEKPILIGQGNGIYYHIPDSKYLLIKNTNRASLCQTGFTNKAFDLVKEKCHSCISTKTAFLDIKLWKSPINKYLNLEESIHCVGMKGLKGRLGFSKAHKNTNGLILDVNHSKLKELIKTDYSMYERFING